MDAAFSFYKMKANSSRSSSSLIAPSGAVAAMVVFPGAAGRCDRAWGLIFGCDQTVITGLGAEPWRVMPVEGGVQRALFGTCKHVGHHCVPYAPSFAVQGKYQSAVIVSGLVTFIAAYRYVRIFNSSVDACDYLTGSPKLTSVPSTMPTDTWTGS